MRPELPFLAAGATALIGGARRDGGFPDNGIRAVIATVVLVIVASATAGTKIAPLVHAIGLIAFMGALYGATREFQGKSKL